MNIPYNKIYFILYNPGGAGSFVQSLLQTSKKYSGTWRDVLNQPVVFDFSDGTAHAVKNDCFNNFHGIDLQKKSVVYKDILHDPQVNSLKNYNVLNTYLEKNWKEFPINEYEYYSNRVCSLTFYPLIELLPSSKFIYCKLNPIITLINMYEKVGIKGIRKDGQYITPTNEIGTATDFDLSTRPIKNIMRDIVYEIQTAEKIEKYLISKNHKNVITLDIEDLVYNDDTIELDKLIQFTNITEVKKEVLLETMYLYRKAQDKLNLERHPVWDKVFSLYEKLNK